jgi:transposase
MDTPTATRKLVISNYLAGLTQLNISEHLKVPKSTVCDIIDKFRRSGDVSCSRRGKCGRRRNLTVRDDRLLTRASSANPHATAR